MPCYAPLKGFKGVYGGISWTPSVSYVDVPMEVPCGQCIGCRLERARQWALRIMHEAQMHERNIFVTLSYDDAHLPADGSLCKKDFQDFIKRLRKRSEFRVSYFHCGEYGEENGRPHYHAILFNVDFADRVKWADNARGDPLYTSETLTAIWGKGLAMFGAVTFESAGYCARYCLKKVTGDLACDHYRRISPDGEIYYLVPEYATMSLKPGIGEAWFKEYGADVRNYDGVASGGRMQGSPRFYDKLRRRSEGRDAMRVVKRKRVLKALEHAEDNTEERLAVKKKVKVAALSALKRSL